LTELVIETLVELTTTTGTPERTSVKTSSPPSHSSGSPANDAPYRLIEDVSFGEDVVVRSFTNLYGCAIGPGTRIGTFVEIQKGATIGSSCKVQSHTFVCEGVSIGDGVFVGHGVVFVNDKYPRATNAAGQPQTEADWQLSRIFVESGASIGSGAVILGGVRVGEGAMIGAGAVVAKDVPRGATVAGNPARALNRAASPG
jgi:UDP-2-acetamido-3-amino-2,3-dideoxy-glucuronate N-acetyltransferase